MVTKTVLILDDNPNFLKLAKTVAEATKGFEVEAVAFESADQAIHWLQQGNRPDLTILDWFLKGNDGVTSKYLFDEMVKSSDIHCPIVFLSGSKRNLIRRLGDVKAKNSVSFYQKADGSIMKDIEIINNVITTHLE